jgi:hypothetical protein
MRKTFILLPAALLTVLAAGPVAAIAIAGPAGKVPAAASPSQQQKTGTIESIDLGSRAIVINDVGYLFPSTNVVLHNKTSSVATAQQLKKGMRINFSSTPGSAGSRPTITDVWLLP